MTVIRKSRLATPILATLALAAPAVHAAVFKAPPGLPTGATDFIDFVTYMANGNIENVRGSTIFESRDPRLGEDTAFDPGSGVTVSKNYFPTVLAGTQNVKFNIKILEPAVAAGDKDLRGDVSDLLIMLNDQPSGLPLNRPDQK